ncbi:hypothetical protein CRM22_011219 [Opisthorchis felineus]|uniref:Protein disulfide-isomerase n=1 Tax=Opisthorchis felineus TaxID=147828 RepID=A0A4V3S8V3_OPIFE|nr:hypothetical protein CRM22_011219 [Opisthorchis felineus]
MGRLLIFLSLVAIVWGRTELTEENNVAVLTKEHFDQVLDEYQYVMVKFYAPWCGHCKALQPEYEKAAGMLKSSDLDVLVAKVDATVETELASAHGVSGYPTLKFRKNGSWISYSGERTAEAIVDWIKNKSRPALHVMNTVDEVENFVKSADVVVVGFIKDFGGNAYRVLEEIADEMDGIPFGVTASQVAFDKYGVKSDLQISLFKSFDEGRVDFEHTVDKGTLSEFIQMESISLVVDFSQDVAGKVFGSPVRKHLVAFVPKSGPYSEMKTKMETVAKKFKGRVHFIIIDTDIEDHLRILEFFGMTKEDVPGYRLIDLADDMTKFKPSSSEFDERLMEAFVDGVLSGSVKPFLMSQDIPEESNEPVRVLVGKNYNEITQDQSKAVFVKLYAPWCGHCKNLAPIWEKLGEAYKDQDDIIIAKMDATVNEAEGLKVHSFPTLKYYAKGSSEAVDYSGERTLEALKVFVDSEGKSGTAGKSKEPKDEL